MLNKFIKVSVIFLGSALFTHALAIENPLKLQVRFLLPEEIKTVEQAAVYFIEPHGYRVQYAGSSPVEARFIGSQSLPIVRPSNNIMSIEGALLGLLRDNQILIVDTENQLISFGNKK